jgi:hypothetical protein
MKLEKWALIAEVIGSVAIVVTLVVLIAEVRTNTELSRVAAYDAVTRDFDDSRTLSLTDPEILELFHQFTQGSLPARQDDSRDALRAGIFVLNVFSGYERAYLSHEAGIFGEAEWSRVERAACQDWGYLEKSGYVSFVSFRLTDEYVEHLNATCTPAFIEAVMRRYRGDPAEGQSSVLD